MDGCPLVFEGCVLNSAFLMMFAVAITSLNVVLKWKRALHRHKKWARTEQHLVKFTRIRFSAPNHYSMHTEKCAEHAVCCAFCVRFHRWNALLEWIALSRKFFLFIIISSSISIIKSEFGNQWGAHFMSKIFQMKTKLELIRWREAVFLAALFRSTVNKNENTDRND